MVLLRQILMGIVSLIIILSISTIVIKHNENSTILFRILISYVQMLAIANSYQLEWPDVLAGYMDAA